MSDITGQTTLDRHPAGSRIIRTIHTAKSFLGLSQPEYREMLRQRYGVSSSKDLTRKQGDDLIEHFRSMGFGRPKRKWTCTLCAPHQRERGPIPKETIYPASAGQLFLINELTKAVKWKAEDGYRRWLFKYFALTEIKWSPEASSVITALKGLLRSQHKDCVALINLKHRGTRVTDQKLRKDGREVSLEDLHPIYRKIAIIVGVENAIKIGRVFGKQALYLPGLEAALNIKARDREIFRERNEGRTYTNLATKYGLTETWIREIVKRGRKGKLK
jgi:hypothetical protein